MQYSNCVSVKHFQRMFTRRIIQIDLGNNASKVGIKNSKQLRAV